MKQFLIKHWNKIAGVFAGALGGYLYYYYVGCVSGTCPITSNPYRMMLYGALIGYLVFDLFSDRSSTEKVEQRVQITEDQNDPDLKINNTGKTNDNENN